MATYIVMYNFTPEGAKGIRESVKRTGRIRQDNARVGFKIREIFWTQGAHDMVAIVDAPSEEAMMGAMLNIIGAGNVTATTMRAFDATEMGRILAQTLPLSDDRAGTNAPKPAAASRKPAARKK